MSKKTETETEDSALIAKLRAQKAAAEKAGRKSTTLPISGVEVTWPAFLNHGMWMRAQRLAKGKSATDYYLISACRFDGERITITTLQELFDSNDIMHLAAEVMGDILDDDDADGKAGESAGNGLH